MRTVVGKTEGCAFFLFLVLGFVESSLHKRLGYNGFS